MSAPLSPNLRALVELPDRERKLGAFVLVRQLGRGGFAPVWLAREVYGERELRTAAVKLFALDASPGPDSQGESQQSAAARHHDMVIDEAQSLCKVEHPNIVRFYSLLVDEARGVIGLAMEYVDGEPLDARIEQKGTLSVDEALEVGVAVASALAAVHKKGLVHRDVKPANVVESGGVFKLIDFGIAAADAPIVPSLAGPKKPKRVVLDDLPIEIVGTKMSMLAAAYTIRTVMPDSGSTLPFAATGTLGYIDPVCVAEGAAAAPSSDLYGLGALLFECLTGKLPAMASAATGTGLRGDVLDGRASPAPLASVAPHVPERLAKIVDALLAPTRDARPASAADVARALDAIRSPTAAIEPPMPMPMPNTPDVHARVADDRGPRVAIPIAVAALVVVGAVAAYRFAAREPPPPTAAAIVAPAPAPSASPSAVEPTATIRVVKLAIAPPTASVEIDGAAAVVSAGSVEIRGASGSLHRVRVFVGKQETVGDVVVTESGAVPPKIELGVKPIAPGSAMSNPLAGSKPGPGTSSTPPTAPTPTTTTAPTKPQTLPLNRNFD